MEHVEHDPFMDGLPISKKVIAIAMFSLAEDIYVLDYMDANQFLSMKDCF